MQHEQEKSMNRQLMERNADEYIQKKLYLYGSLENMPESVREVVEALMNKE